ncbi:MAG: hypothetical protein KDI42_10935, partial [Gammaproteobacteria bacterium]|nr:hypothetical protein [Gammaproteobacteria bacterium]
EPFVHFLVEVTSGKGRLRREYTLLLDPPSSLPRVTPAPAPVERSAPRNQAPVPVAPRQTISDGRPQMPQRQVQPVPAARAPAPPSVRPAQAPVPTADSYGPTGKEETLWGIASKMARNAGTTTQQMMLAVLRSNPEAFHGNNINSMKTGVVLRVPGVNEARRLDKDAAIREVRSQNADWQRIAGDVTRLDRLPGQDAPKATEPRASKPSPAQEKKSGAVPEAAGQLKIVGGDAVTDTEVVAELERLVKEVALANETAESRRLENEDLRDRVGRLEQGIDKMQRLIELKDDEIASLQANAEAAKAQVIESDSPPDAARQAQPEPITNTAKTESQSQPVAEPKASSEVEASRDAAKPKPIKKVVKPRIQPPPEPGLIDDLIDNPLVMIGGSVLVVLLLLLALMRRRKAASATPDKDDKQDSLRQADDDIGDGKPKGKSRFANFDLKNLFARFGKKKGAVSADDAALAAAVVGTAAVAASATLGPDGRAQGDEHFAAGRFSEAATQYSQAAQATPDDFDLRARLIEAHFKANDGISFEREAEAFYADREGVEDGPWQNIVNMGRQLLPAHPLFAVEAPPEPAFESGVATEGNEDLVALDDLDLSDMDIETDFGADLSTSSTAPAVGGELDLDSADFDIGEVDFGGAGIEVGDGDGNIDDLLSSGLDMESGLGLDQLDIGEDLNDGLGGRTSSEVSASASAEATPAAASAEPAPALSGSDMNADLDFEIDDDLADALSGSGEAGSAADATATISDDDDDDSMVFDLSGFEIEEDDDGEIDLGEFDVPDNGATELDMQLDALGEDIDMLGEMSAQNDESGIEEIDLGADFGGSDGDDMAGPDEVDTKLDLARAYVDMGDPDGARVMLEEVVAEGSDAQRQEAQALIDQMA